MNRLEAAVAELVDALREEASASRPNDAPMALLDIPTAAARLGGVGRTLIYSMLGDGRLRSIKVGRRRLIPADALQELATRGATGRNRTTSSESEFRAPNERAAEVATSTATANARSVARRSQPEYTANVPHIPRHRTPAPRDAA